jgi:predicted nucleic acid-binding protein
MKLLVDTGPLLRQFNIRHAEHTVCRAAIEVLLARGDTLCVTPSALAEFWCVATQYFGFAVPTVAGAVDRLASTFEVLTEPPDLYPRWRRIVGVCNCVASQVYDARQVAVMEAYGLAHILTLNVGHFTRFADALPLIVLEPRVVVA